MHLNKFFAQILVRNLLCFHAVLDSCLRRNDDVGILRCCIEKITDFLHKKSFSRH